MNKKILITIGRAGIARNLLKNDFYNMIREKYSLIIATPAFKDESFRKEFEHKNVEFADLPSVDRGMIDEFILFFHKNLIYNSTVNQKNRWGIIGDINSKRPNYFKYLIKKTIFYPLSKVKFFRFFFRFFDSYLQKGEVLFYDSILDKYSPDLVISTNVAGDEDAALIKSAKKKHIKTVGMPKSWDNLSKNSFRVKADYLVVWSEFMKREAIEFQNYRTEDVVVVGVPQFDYYKDKARIWNREKFCEIYGLDPNKKIVFFGSEGRLFPSDTEIAEILSDFVKNTGLQLLIRPHFSYKNDFEKFKGLVGKESVVVDNYSNPSPCFKDWTDYSDYSMDRFLNSIYHSDVIINTCSTLSLDALSLDKPVISIAFDGFKEKIYKESIKRWYETNYAKELIRDGGVSLVSSKDELFVEIMRYLDDPTYKKRERIKTKNNLCFKVDGMSGSRFFKFIDKIIGK